MHRSLMGDNDFATMLERGQIVGGKVVTPTAQWEESEPVARAVKLITAGIAVGLTLPAIVSEMLLISLIGFLGMVVGACLIPRIDKWMRGFLMFTGIHFAWRVGLLVMDYFPAGDFLSTTAFVILSILFGCVGVAQLFCLGRGVYLHKGITQTESLLLPAAYALIMGCGYISGDVIRYIAQGACALVIIAILVRIYRSAE